MKHLKDRLSLSASFLYMLLLSSVSICADTSGNVSGIKIGDTQYPFGESIEVIGVCRHTHSFFDFDLGDTIAAIQGLRINGVANQEGVRFDLCTSDHNLEKKIKALKKGQYYKVRGEPNTALISGLHRVCGIAVRSIEPIPAAPLAFRDFLGKPVSFSGTAGKNHTFIYEGKTAHLTNIKSWPNNIAGKKIAVHGIIAQEQGKWVIRKPTWQFTELADMIGNTVTLAGSLGSLNGHWWFNYNNEVLYLTHHNGPPMVLPTNQHGSSATVTGMLVRQLRPSLGQISLKVDRDLVPTYVIRGAKVKLHDKEVTIDQRFGRIYNTPNKLVDGVPKLVPEVPIQRNIMGNETSCMSYVSRNNRAINYIIKNNQPAMLNTLAKRMNDTSLVRPLRLIHATILARLNDKRGRDFLRQEAASPDKKELPDVLYCLGQFPYIGPESFDFKTDCQWAASLLVSIMKDKATAKQALTYSTVPSVLASIDSANSRKALLDYALNNEGGPERFARQSVTRLLCQPEVKLPPKDLLRLEKVSKNRGTRRTILRAMLRANQPGTARLFSKELGDSFAYMDMRDVPSPVFINELKKLLPSLSGEAKSNARMLIALSAKDPAQEAIKLLHDDTFPDKTLVTYELRRLKDPRCITTIYELLRDAPADYFKTNPSHGIEHCLAAISNGRPRKAVQHLVALLSVDLGRFGGYIKREGMTRIVAAHLINITGESFGIDQVKWREWEKNQPDKRFQSPATNGG